MFKNYIKVSLRSLWKYKGYSLINLVGLATGMACFILILLWVQDELSYDRSHENTNQIYRAVRLDRDELSQGVCRTGAPWGPLLIALFTVSFQSIRVALSNPVEALRHE